MTDKYKIKVCHVTSAHNRYDVRIFHKECKSLASNGYDVTLLVNDNLPDEYIDGVNIISTNYSPQNRYQRMISSKKQIKRRIIEVDSDIYHLHDPDLLPIGNKLKRLGGKVIFDSHEDVPNQITDKSWIPLLIRNLIANVYKSYEKYSTKKYDAVISVTPHIVERFSKINPNSIMITNYPIINPDPDKNIVRNPNNAICFAGGINQQWNHDIIILAIEKIKGIKYILAGKGKKDYLESLERLPGWSNVDYRGKVPHQEVKEIYAQAMAGIALNYSNQAKGEGTLGNTKLFEYMAAQLPVICSDYKLWKEIIEGNQCGICINPNNEDEIKNAILYILNNSKEAQEMGKNGRKAVLERYNWKLQEKTMLDLYRQL